jgi:hypothetical protein
MTPWYEDESLTQISMYPASIEGGIDLVLDGEEHPDAGDVMSLRFDESGALVEQVSYIETYSLEQEAYEWSQLTLSAVSGAELADQGSHDGLGIHWGRWNLGDYERTIDPEPDFSGGEPQPGSDWHWVVLEDVDDLTTADQMNAMSGTATFSWAGGNEIRATDGESVYSYEVQTMDLDFNFDGVEGFEGMHLESGAIELVTSDGPSDISVTGTAQDETAMGAIVTGTNGEIATFNAQLYGEQYGATVDGLFVGEEADGALVNFSVTDSAEELFGLEGVGALEKQ